MKQKPRSTFNQERTLIGFIKTLDCRVIGFLAFCNQKGTLRKSSILIGSTEKVYELL